MRRLRIKIEIVWARYCSENQRLLRYYLKEDRKAHQFLEHRQRRGERRREESRGERKEERG